MTLKLNYWKPIIGILLVLYPIFFTGGCIHSDIQNNQTLSWVHMFGGDLCGTVQDGFILMGGAFVFAIGFMAQVFTVPFGAFLVSDYRKERNERLENP